MNSGLEVEYAWLDTGEKALEEMLSAIRNAARSVRLEMYIFHSGAIADQFREALLDACQRGLSVRVLIDALGSAYLTESFWSSFRAAGGEIRWFNPLALHRLAIRDHRKMLVCDEDLAFVGGFNIAVEYCGDGVSSGWRDLGLRTRGPLAQELAEAFDEMYAKADFKHKPFTRLRKSLQTRSVNVADAKLLLGGPGRNNPLKRALRDDLDQAQEVQIVTPYFVPPWRIRRILMRLARTGVRVRLILPGKCDLPVLRMAAHSFYRRCLSAGIEIYEYQPQILHAKLFIIDQVVYAGSANLDGRSLSINYELMVRLSNQEMVQKGREIFASLLGHSKRIEQIAWRRGRTLVDRLLSRLAHLILARLDPYIAERQLHRWTVSLRKVRLAKKHKPSISKAAP